MAALSPAEQVVNHHTQLGQCLVWHAQDTVGLFPPDFRLLEAEISQFPIILSLGLHVASPADSV